MPAAVADYLRQCSRFTRNARLYLVLTSITGVYWGLSGVVANLFLLVRGFQEGFLGTLVVASSAAGVIAAMPAARFVNNRGRQAGLYACLIVGLLGTSAILAGPTAVVVGAVVLIGVSNALVGVVQSPLLTDESQPAERPHLFSVSAALMIGAGVVGAWLGGWLPGRYASLTGLPADSAPALRFALAIGALLFLLALLPVAWMRLGQGRAVPTRGSLLAIPRVSDTAMAWRVSAVALLWGIGAGLIAPFFNVFFNRHLGASPGQIGSLMAWNSLMAAVGALLSPLAVRRFGKVSTMAGAFILSVPLTLTMVSTRAIWPAAAAMWIRGALTFGVNPVFGNHTMELFPPEDRAAVSGLINISWTVGWALSAQLAGLIMESGNYILPYYIAAGFYIILGLAYRLFFGRGSKPAIPSAKAGEPAAA
ncbi:MAG: MFS transporter [Bacillota bacterium]